jgi:Holliday junction resolvase
MRKIGKVDANQAEIVKALRKAGYAVQSLANIGAGCPDLMVGCARGNFLLEIKDGKGKLTEDQVTWHRMWPAPVHLVRTIEEALDAVMP